MALDHVRDYFHADYFYDPAVEEAIINAMGAAETMEGINGNKAYALPHKLVN